MLFHQIPKHENVTQKSRTGIAASSSVHKYKTGTVTGSEMNIRYSTPCTSRPSSAPVVQLMKGLAVGARVKVCDIENNGTISYASIKRELSTGYYELDNGTILSEAVVFPDNTEDSDILESLRTLIQYTMFNRSLPRSHTNPDSFPGHTQKTMGNVMNPVSHLQGAIDAAKPVIIADENIDDRKKRVAHAAAQMAFQIVTGHYFHDGNGRNAIYSIYDILDKNQFYLRRSPVQVHAFLFGEEALSNFSFVDVDKIADWLCKNMTHKPIPKPHEDNWAKRAWSLPNRESGIRKLEDDRKVLTDLSEKQRTGSWEMKPAETDKIRDWKKYLSEGSRLFRRRREKGR